ncbi:hypothetical protein WN944_023648 [Citrus x changshan-huyou]|uniref:RING-type E3 ubiquitin transferase n=1 Tax=Citrus x changshan-huyou TaxID=2935761 RepID=A0AAP0N4I7_9ROSI
MLVKGDTSWECEEVKPEDGEYSYVCGNYTVQSKSVVKFYLQSDTWYNKEWWCPNSEGHNDLLCKIEQAVGVPGNHYSVEIDAADMMSTPTPEALITSISEKVLIFLKPAATEDNLKVLASDLISKSRQIITTSSSKCSIVLIGISIGFNTYIYLDEIDMQMIEYYKRMLPADYIASLKPLPTVILDGNYYNISESDQEESCSICWGDMYSSGCRISSIQFLNEYLGGSDHHHDVIRMPCSHDFHANCITKWLKTTNSCPLCRFKLPTSATLLAILDLFDYIHDLEDISTWERLLLKN